MWESEPASPGTGVSRERIGVLLLNLGGPECLDDVQPFLFNLFADPDIIRLPAAVSFLQRPLAGLVSTLRAPKVRASCVPTHPSLGRAQPPAATRLCPLWPNASALGFCGAFNPCCLLPLVSRHHTAHTVRARKAMLPSAGEVRCGA